ncbi:MAG: hypothetical protein ACRCXT_14610 [Paraclostridium sp.]
MKFTKMASKSVALALATVTISSPILNTVYATNVVEQNDNITTSTTISTNNDDIFVDESLLLGNANAGRTFSDYNTFYENVENVFKSKFGNENEFKLIASSKDFRTEGNGYTGELKVTTYKDGLVDDVLTINYLDNVKNYLNQLEADELDSSTYAESYVVNTIKTGGPDPFRFNVRTGGNYSSKYKMYAASWYGSSKTWYKNTDWKTGYTKGLYNELRYARNNVNNIASSLSPGVSLVEVLAAIAQFVGPTTAIPGINTIAAVLAAFSFALPTIKVAGYTLDYIKNINVAQYNYIRI